MQEGLAGDLSVDLHLWALVLAAGEGSRLRSLTTTAEGVAVPKQYCSLHGGPSLLENALYRASVLAPQQRICTVVASQHRQWWQETLAELSDDSIVVQPKNRGTAIGIMLPLLHILKRDPEARIVLLPSDHHVRDERVLTDALSVAAARLREAEDKIVLLGIEPDEADCELGYILPGEALPGGTFAVASFVEKPALRLARQLLQQGALWNTFIVAANASTLLTLFAERYPQVLSDMHELICGGYDREITEIALENLYDTLPTLDFSRDVMQDVHGMLEVLATPACGWSDLGTPKRVKDVLRKCPYNGRIVIPTRLTSSIPITLATQLSASA